MTDKELIETLSAHLSKGVPVSDFLCAEIESRSPIEALLPLLESDDGETVSYALNLVGSDERAFPIYFNILAEEKFDEDIRDAVSDKLKENADAAASAALEFYRAGKAKEYMLEVLSRVKARAEEIYQILLNAFLLDSEQVPMHASYLAAYGDDRALPHLLKKIDDRTIGFVEFQELKYAIEALGGEYNEPRDFSEDKDFVAIGEASEAELFNADGTPLS